MKIAVGILLALIVSVSSKEIKLSGNNQNQDDMVNQNFFIPESRIVNGGTAQEGQFPYQAHITIRYGLLGITTFECGGSIIADGWILTAGHCYRELDLLSHVSYDVTVGSLSGSGTGGEKDTVLPPNAFIHPDYKVENDIPVYDVALLKTRVFPHSINIKPIALIPIGSLLENHLTVSGFGYISNGGPSSDVLRFAVMKGIDNLACSTVDSVGWFCATVDDTTENTGTPCTGDYGGPATITFNNEVVQAGVASFGNANCSPLPTAFADLTNEIIGNWIKERLGITED